MNGYLEFAESEMERGSWAKIKAMAELAWESKNHQAKENSPHHASAAKVKLANGKIKL